MSEERVEETRAEAAPHPVDEDEAPETGGVATARTSGDTRGPV